jgi:hypothetical protein
MYGSSLASVGRRPSPRPVDYTTPRHRDSDRAAEPIRPAIATGVQHRVFLRLRVSCEVQAPEQGIVSGIDIRPGPG